jgi:hypothetical protein
LEDIEMKASPLGFQRIKAIALAVTDRERAGRFYGETLGLAPAFEADRLVGYFLGPTILMLKDDWYGAPTALPNPRLASPSLSIMPRTWRRR